MTIIPSIREIALLLSSFHASFSLSSISEVDLNKSFEVFKHKLGIS